MTRSTEEPIIPRDDEAAKKKIEEGMVLIEQAKTIMSDRLMPLFIRKRKVLALLKTDYWVKKIMEQTGVQDPPDKN
jgi:hypothetical protein